MSRKPPMLSPLLSGLAAFALAALSVSAAPLELKNPGFEEGATGWTLTEKEGVSISITPEAAHEGSGGLRVEDQSPSASARVMSEALPVEPGAAYRVSFFANTTTPGRIGVFMRFCNAARQTIDPENLVYANVDQGNGQWYRYHAEARAPLDAAWLMIWVHSYSTSTGAADFDEFSVEKVEDSALPPATASATPGVPAAPADAGFTPEPPRQGPAKIIIKADDLRQRRGSIDPRWLRFIDLIKERKIKAGIGIIANSLDGDYPEYFQSIKELHESGLFEFWNHGYDHLEWKEGDKRILEFQGSSYEHQKKHMSRSNELAREKLGFPFRTFGAPFAVHDENTLKVLEEDPDIKILLSGRPVKQGDPDAGKLVLNRRWDVNIEQPLFVPNSQKFIEGYTKHPEVDYFVIQGHPWRWDDAGFAEFEKIIDFALQQGAVFVTPSEYAKLPAEAESSAAR